jgi:hypothetical protein
MAQDSGLGAMIAALERQEFEKWAIEDGFAYRDEHGLWFYRNGGDGLFEAWQGRAKLVKQCRGIAHAGCHYLAPCGSVCNKCGRSV